MLIIGQDIGRSLRATRKGKETTADERELNNESPGGDGSEENSTQEYIKKLQAELAVLKAAHSMALSSHTDRHRKRGGKGVNEKGVRRYGMLALSEEAMKCHLLE